MRKMISGLFLCVAGTVLSLTINHIVIETGVPLYMDTIFTVTVTFLAGPFWGSLTGALHNIVFQTIRFWGWEGYLFAICNITTAWITWFFIRRFPAELSLHVAGNRLNKIMDRSIVLIIMAMVLCFIMSILGGLISSIIIFMHTHKEGAADIYASSGILSPSLLKRGVPLVLAEILSRIPVNIIDRLIAAFGGYGIALALRRFSFSHKSAILYTGERYAGGTKGGTTKF